MPVGASVQSKRLVAMWIGNRIVNESSAIRAEVESLNSIRGHRVLWRGGWPGEKNPIIAKQSYDCHPDGASCDVLKCHVNSAI